MSVVEFRLSEKDRKKYGSDEWIPLDLDRLYDTPAHMLERWEAECGMAIDQAVADVIRSRPKARSLRTLIWVARKQTGDATDNDDGQPEPFARLAELRTLLCEFRDRPEPEAVDAVPPAEPQPEPPAP